MFPRPTAIPRLKMEGLELKEVSHEIVEKEIIIYVPCEKILAMVSIGISLRLLSLFGTLNFCCHDAFLLNPVGATFYLI